MILNCTNSDVSNILKLYDDARELQQARNMVIWPYFSEGFIMTEIMEQRQFKIVDNGVIVCNWAISFKDKEIWGSRDKGDSIYIHRICVNKDFRGKRYIDNIVTWAGEFGRIWDKKYIRLDTLGNNKKLIKHYTSAGFKFLGMIELTDTRALPQHYQDHPQCCLFEIELSQVQKMALL